MYKYVNGNQFDRSQSGFVVMVTMVTVHLVGHVRGYRPFMLLNTVLLLHL